MFKFALCALFTVAAAKPDVVWSSQLTPLTTSYLSPATTTISKEGFITQGPLLYSSPLGYAHYIKKRDAQLAYFAPSTYLTNPAVTTYTSSLPSYTTPIWNSANLPIVTTHFIKKRSAPVLATSYIAPIAETVPLVTPTLTATPLVTSPLIATPLVSQPIAHAAHLIKKRSAPLISSYSAPGAITYQSRFDLNGAPYIGAYGAPWGYSAGLHGYTNVI